MPQFTFATYNVENLFPAGTNDGPPTQEIYDRKLQNLVDTLSLIEADIVALQEIGSETCLNDLKAGLGGLYPHSAVSNRPDNRGIRVAILSRLPIADPPINVVDFPDTSIKLQDLGGETISKFKRGVLHAQIDMPGWGKTHVLTAHLKSKLPSYPGGRFYSLNNDEWARGVAQSLIVRTAQACALRCYLNSLMFGNNEPFIVAADFNDGPHALTTKIVAGPVDRSLSRPDKNDDVRLYNLYKNIPLERRYSRIHKKEEELLDQILVSYEFIFHVKKVDSIIENISSITEDGSKRNEEVWPDHAPVFVSFERP